MGPPSYKRSVVDRNVVMRRMTVYGVKKFFGVQRDDGTVLLYTVS